jgi:hypothetical protein
VEALVLKIAMKSEKWLAKMGYVDGRDWDLDPDDALPILHEASIVGKTALGKRRGFKIRRVQKFHGREFKLPPKCASCRGYSLHGGIVVGARNRKGLEKLCRYIARPPLAKSRIVDDGGGEYRILLKTPWSDGTTSIRLSLLEVMERLAALVPPPRAHQVLYHGVFAPNAKYRKEILPKYRNPKPKGKHLKLVRKEKASAISRHVPWSQLLWRVFGVAGWCCRNCGRLMELRAVVIRPPATTKIINGFVRAGLPYVSSFRRTFAVSSLRSSRMA